MKKNTRKTCSLLLSFVMLLLSGCSQTGGNSQTSSGSGDPQMKISDSQNGINVSQDTDIVAAVSVDFTTMDPMDTSDTLSGGIQRLIMDGLFGFDDDMTIIPMLATEYTANENATEFTIKLRQGVSFSDGTPWDASAAKANFDKWGDKTLGLKRTTLLCNVLKTVEIVDEYTLKVTLTEPFGAFINTLAHPACVIMSPKQIEAGEKACAENPIGTGQYQFVEWVAGEYLKIELNKNWWGYDSDICGGTALSDKDAGYKTVTFKPVSESATRVAMLQSGDAQIVWPVPTESMQGLKNDSSVSVDQGEGIVVRYLFMNTQKAPFNDVKVRQAINYAVDKNAYVAVVWNGMASVATSIIGPSVQFYKANDPYEYNVEKAKQLLAEAGYPDGFTCSVIYSNTTQNQKQAEFYKQQLEQVGINLELNGLESAIVNEKVQDCTTSGAEAEVELFMSGWSPSTGDADWGIRPIVAIESQPPMSYNISYYENQELDSLIYEGLKSADLNIRAEAYKKAQDIIWKECPILCLSNDFNTWATSAKVSGVSIYPDGAINLRNGKITK